MNKALDDAQPEDLHADLDEAEGRCTSCNTANLPTSFYCSRCGARLPWAPAEPLSEGGESPRWREQAASLEQRATGQKAEGQAERRPFPPPPARAPIIPHERMESEGKVFATLLLVVLVVAVLGVLLLWALSTLPGKV